MCIGKCLSVLLQLVTTQPYPAAAYAPGTRYAIPAAVASPGTYAAAAAAGQLQ